MEDPIQLDARAKLTLTLRVLGTRSDGFHELEALTVMISAPADRLVIAPAPAGVVDVPAALQVHPQRPDRQLMADQAPPVRSCRRTVGW